MDVTSLLNNAQQPCYSRGGTEVSSKDHNHGKPLPMPWAEDSSQRSDRGDRQIANFWVEGRVGALQLEESISQSSSGPPVSPKHVHETALEANNRSKRPSMGFPFGVTSQLPIQLARNNLSCDEAHIFSTRMAPQDHRASVSGEVSAASNHKLSFSNSSLMSSGSSLSECYSRLSSAASVSGVSSSNIPIIDTPSVYAKPFGAQSPQIDLDIAAQSASPRLIEEVSAAKQNQLIVTGNILNDRPGVVFSLRKLGQPTLLGDALRSDLTTRPKYHKRATSAPLLDSCMTTSASDTLNDRYPTSLSTELAMGSSTPKALRTQAEEAKPNMAAAYQDVDPDHRLHPLLRNGQTSAAIDMFLSRGAVLQPQEQVSDQTSDTTSLAQSTLDVITREASLEALSPTSMAPLEEEPRSEEGEDEALEAPNSSAAPDWIIQRLGTGYTTEQMLEVADRLYLEIENGTLGQVPEVEFLPDITESEAGNIAKLVRSRKQARTAALAVEAKASKRRSSEDADCVSHGEPSLLIQHDASESMNTPRKRIRLSPLGADFPQHPLRTPLPSTVPSYATSNVLASSAGAESSVPRTLPTAPKAQVSSPGHSQGPIAHTYGLSSSEFRRPHGFGGLYSHDQQQHPAQYPAGTESFLQRNRDPYYHQRLPSIAHLAGASDLQSSDMAIQPFRGSWASINEDPNMPRVPRLRSYSDNIPTSQPMLEYPRPSSSGTSQFGTSYFDNRAAASLTHEQNPRSYSREYWPESSHVYAPAWPQRSSAQQQHHYYDQVTRPQLDSLRTPAYLGQAKQRPSAERVE
ncbi:hypothetical protein TsFJ059_006336 [Trichoderma semiorbis]|uniref:Uncharacterized protein n=1 Tax=Trichoderma semiorbis TaxID=1491008 RepID=A0A9P8KKI0_9HYPO|nr:hypothetical protein TsFJ059_006336 [Trichoderma semiorbis]